MLLKSRASLTCFRACFLPGRAKDLSAPGKQSCDHPVFRVPRREHIRSVAKYKKNYFFSKEQARNSNVMILSVANCCKIKKYRNFLVSGYNSSSQISRNNPLCRSGQPWELQQVEVSRIPRQSTHTHTKRQECQPSAPAAFTPPQKTCLVLISVRGWVDPRAIVRSEGLSQWSHRESNPLPCGLLAQCPNQLRASCDTGNMLQMERSHVQDLPYKSSQPRSTTILSLR